MFAKYEDSFTQAVIEAIESARIEAGLSVNTVVQRAGIGRNSWFTKMRGDRAFTTEDIHKIAVAIGVDPLDMLSAAAAHADRARRTHLHVVSGGLQNGPAPFDVEAEERKVAYEQTQPEVGDPQEP